MVKIGDRIKITSDNDNYDKYRAKTWVVSHIARNKQEHPGYDEGVGGTLIDCKGLPFSLYSDEYQIVGSSSKRGGKGWREAPDNTGKAPEHKKAALKAQAGARGAMNTPMRKAKAIRVGTKVKFNKNSERVQQILPFHKGYEDKVGEVVGRWGKSSYTIDFGADPNPDNRGGRYEITLEPKDLVIVSPPKRGYKHADAPTMEKVEKFTENLHGSGIDYDWHTEETKSAIKATNAFHTMDEWGGYDAIVDFEISFPKNEPMGNFKLAFTHGSGYQAKKHMLRDYLENTIASVLDELGYR